MIGYQLNSTSNQQQGTSFIQCKCMRSIQVKSLSSQAVISLLPFLTRRAGDKTSETFFPMYTSKIVISFHKILSGIFNDIILMARSVQDCSISIANALEILQSYIKPWICSTESYTKSVMAPESSTNTCVMMCRL